MHEKLFKDTVEKAKRRYGRVAEKVTRRDLLIGIGSFMGGAALALAAVETQEKDNAQNSEKEQELRFATGIDISYPQGSAEQYADKRHDFVIVGVNEGLPTKKNPYLVSQLRIASEITQDADPDRTEILPIQLYLNAANPADYINEITTWPTDNDTSIGQNPCGDCDGADSQACMYIYGWQRTKNAVEAMFVEAAEEAGVNADPAGYMWWLDVEIDNSWRENPREGEDPQESNKIVLESMVAYLQSIGAEVGIYSVRSHWSEIIGDTVDENSNLYHLPSWVAKGKITEEDAKKTLLEEQEKPFTSGGRVAMVQRVGRESAESSNELDYNYAIIPE